MRKPVTDARLSVIGASAVLAAAACGGGTSAPATTADAPATSAAATTTAATKPAESAATGETSGTTLTSDFFTPRLTLTLPKEPDGTLDYDDGFGGGFPLPGAIWFVNEKTVRADPESTQQPPQGTNPGDIFLEADASTEAADLTTWLQHHPRLEASSPKPVTLGGLQGVEFDVIAKKPYRSAYCGSTALEPPKCIVLLGIGETGASKDAVATAYQLSPGHRLHVIVLDANGRQLAILLDAGKGLFKRFVADAKELLSSLQVG